MPGKDEFPDRLLADGTHESKGVCNRSRHKRAAESHPRDEASRKEKLEGGPSMKKESSLSKPRTHLRELQRASCDEEGASGNT